MDYFAFDNDFHVHLCFINTLTCVCMLSHFSHVHLFATPLTVACPAPLSMEFSRQEYWNGLPFPIPWPNSRSSWIDSLSSFLLLPSTWAGIQSWRFKLEKKLSGNNDDKCSISDKVANNVRNTYHYIRNSHHQKQQEGRMMNQETRQTPHTAWNHLDAPFRATSRT